MHYRGVAKREVGEDEANGMLLSCELVLATYTMGKYQFKSALDVVPNIFMLQTVLVVGTCSSSVSVLSLPMIIAEKPQTTVDPAIPAPVKLIRIPSAGCTVKLAVWDTAGQERFYSSLTDK